MWSAVTGRGALVSPQRTARNGVHALPTPTEGTPCPPQPAHPTVSPQAVSPQVGRAVPCPPRDDRHPTARSGVRRAFPNVGEDRSPHSKSRSQRSGTVKTNKPRLEPGLVLKAVKNRSGSPTASAVHQKTCTTQADDGHLDRRRGFGNGGPRADNIAGTDWSRVHIAPNRDRKGCYAKIQSEGGKIDGCGAIKSR